MIERFEGRMELRCDECPRVMRRIYDEDDFDVMIQDAKDARWRIFKDGQTWCHVCQSCGAKGR